MSSAQPVRRLLVLLGSIAGISALIDLPLYQVLVSRDLIVGGVLTAFLIFAALSSLLGVAVGLGLSWMGRAVLEQISAGMIELRAGKYPRLLVKPSNYFGRYLREFNGLSEELRIRNEKLKLRTEKREQELAKAYRLLGIFQQQVRSPRSEGFLLANDDNITVTVDRTAAKLIGRPAELIIGTPLDKVVADLRDQSTDSRAFDERYSLLRTGVENEIRLEISSTDGLRIARVSHHLGRPSRSELGLAAQGVAANNDLDRMKSEFVATVSHELRTPLTSINGALALIRSGSGGHIPLEARELLDIALSNTARLVTTVNNMLDIGQIEHRGVQLQVAPASLEAIVEGAVGRVEQEAMNRKINIEAFLPDRPPLLRVDSTRIVQVLTNLLSNAIKFSSEQCKVLLTATVQQELLMVSVQDFGIGMSAEFLSRLFRTFEHEQAALTRETQGCGLGLAICKRIVEAHGGRIWAESKEKSGSTFCFTLPLSVRRRSESARALLVVDEDDDLTKQLENLCQEHDLYLIPCHNTKDVLRLTRYYNPVLILLDRMAKPLDAQVLCEQLAQYPETQVVPIVCFGFHGGLRASGAQKIHCAGKPVSSEEFGMLLDRFSLEGKVAIGGTTEI